MDNLDKIFGRPRIPKQFIVEAKGIEVKSLVSIEEAREINNSFQKKCDLLQQEELEFETYMNDIVAGGTCYTKKINRY